ncbi:hypothetical protein LOZ58_003645 [Ophidiomyces ophidiicola]|nr:hypothetical protein LOZ58_003645 [Ophidiomyces ophidiicola]
MAQRRPVFSAALALRSAFLPKIPFHAGRQVINTIRAYGLRSDHISYRPLDRNFPTSTVAISESLDIPQNPPKNAPQNEAIRYPRVHLVNDDGSLSSLIPTRQIFRTFNRIESVLVLLMPPSEEYGAICKVVSKRFLREQEYQMSRQAVKAKVGKQIELNWAIEPNDLDMRLKQAESFLSKGKPVELVLLKKARKKRATVDQATALVDTIQKWILEKGAVQTKPPEGEVLGFYYFKLEPKGSDL